MHRGVPHFDTRIRTGISPAPTVDRIKEALESISALRQRTPVLESPQFGDPMLPTQHEQSRARQWAGTGAADIGEVGAEYWGGSVGDLDWLGRTFPKGGTGDPIDVVGLHPQVGADEFLGGPTIRPDWSGVYNQHYGRIGLRTHKQTNGGEGDPWGKTFKPIDSPGPPGATEAHEFLHHALATIKDNPVYWEDITFIDPDTGKEELLIDALMPDFGIRGPGGAQEGRIWDAAVAHDIIYSSSPHTYARARVGKDSGASFERSAAIRNAAEKAAGRIRDEVNTVGGVANFNYGASAIQNLGRSPTGSPTQEEAGLLSDKMSNEDWGKFIMGKGAEEERKTEVSKQKVEAKRQAQVKAVKKEAEKKPSTVREAKAQGSLYFWDSKGNKKLALTADDVKKFKASDKYDPEGKGALTQMANIGEKEGIEGLLTTAAPKPKDVEVPKAEKKGYNFRNNWEKYYYAGKPKGDEYMEGFQERLSSKKAIPDKAKEAIEIAVDIFGGDKDKNGKRYSADRLRKDLQNIGRVESQYRKKESTAGGTEKGWWQVKPSTAKDALENAKKHFGKKFNKHFKKHGGYDGLLDRAKKGTLAALMLKDEELAAAFAAVQVIRTFDQE